MRKAYLAIALFPLTACTVHVRDGANNPPPPPPAAAAPAPAAAPAAAAPAPGPVAAAPAPANTTGGVVGAPSTPGYDPLPPNQPPVVEPPAPPIAKPVPVQPNVANGMPPNLKPGAPAAYWVWRDGAGWHVRTTTAKTLQRFHGKITGDITSVTPVRIEMKDRLKSTSSWIIFAFDTAGHMDGFDFQANGCATFNLHPNNNKKIYVGSSELQPSSHYFTLCP
jgi:hypothetical protein